MKIKCGTWLRLTQNTKLRLLEAVVEEQVQKRKSVPYSFGRLRNAPRKEVPLNDTHANYTENVSILQKENEVLSIAR